MKRNGLAEIIIIFFVRLFNYFSQDLTMIDINQN